MTTCIHPSGFSNYRKRRQDKRERQLRKLEKMRASKARIRKERLEAGLLECEPKMERWFPFEFGVRDKRTGETHFRDLVSVRHAAKALGLIMKYI